MKTSEAISIAVQEIGYTESPANSNRTKYGEWYGLNGQAWCLIFLQWVLRDTKLIKRTASCSDLYSWFKQQNKLYSTPQVGDLVFYNFATPNRPSDHIGIVEAVSTNGSIWAIEGNTSSGGTHGVSQSNGGGVYRRQRSQHIVAYGRPDYSDSIKVVRSTLEKGSRGADVIYLQTRLTAMGYTVGKIDGVFGKKTDMAVKQFQTDNGLEIDGIVGPQTWSKL